MAQNKKTIKIGLALSGGGFRASFFHIGVLAQMAMKGMLRNVEVISTVSGGSIIGALYYLHVKKLLEEKTDQSIEDMDYIKIVKIIETDFFRAVEKNIRMRTFINPIKNLKMALPSYSRSDRIGELYDEYIYRSVLKKADKKMIQMRDLKIYPKESAPNFHPKKHNIKRKAKAPIILINSTALNDGHNWRFEASYMGEAQNTDALSLDIDKNMRLLKPESYNDIVKKQQDIELGLAVAASACVPGLFLPLAISGLYPDDIRLQLVDGGVHDNQGVQGLIDEGCNVFIISDPSGQMDDENEPSTGMISVLSRTNSILMDRLREEQIKRVFEKYDVNSDSVAFMHLRKGVPVKVIPYINNKNQLKKTQEVSNYTKSTEFGVDTGVQLLLSKIRTDLDSFTEIEAYSLMMNGYLMSGFELKKMIKSVKSNTAKSDKSMIDLSDDFWKFYAIKQLIENPTGSYKLHLEVAGHTLFKILMFNKIFLYGLIMSVIALIVFLIYRNYDELTSRTFSILNIIAFVAMIILTMLLPFSGKIITALKIFRSPSKFIIDFFIKGLLPVAGAGFIWIHIQTFDKLFKYIGRIKRLK